MVHKLYRHLVRLWTQQSGNSVTEYAVMLGLIIVVSLGAITALGDKIAMIFESFDDIG